VTAAQALAEMKVISEQLRAAQPQLMGKQESVAVEPYRENLTAAARPLLLLLFGAVGCVLLMACATVANLQLTQAAAPPSIWIVLKGSSPETRAKPAEVPDWEWTAALMPVMANRNRIRSMADSMGYFVSSRSSPASLRSLTYGAGAADSMSCN